MHRKIWKICLTSALLAGLTACGAANGNDAAFDQIDRPTGPENVGTHGINDYSQTNRKEFNTRAIGTDPVGHKNLNKGWNQNNSNGRQNLDRHENPNISADYTNVSSKNFPHTKAIVIHDAKYSFTQVSQEQIAEIQKKIEKELKKKFGELTPKLKQQAQQQAQQQIQKQQNIKPPTEQLPKQKTPANEPAQKKEQAQQPAQKPPTQQKEQAQQPQQQQPTQQQPAPQQDQAQAGNIEQVATQVINLTNQERAKQGLPPLKADAQLSSVAKKKSEDMQANNYFSHTSPTYGSPFDMMRDFGVTYKTAGENIAQGQRTPEEVVQAWMNSEGHRKNIMSKDFTHIGVGYEAGGNHWTQMFIGK